MVPDPSEPEEAYPTMPPAFATWCCHCGSAAVGGAKEYEPALVRGSARSLPEE